MSVRMSSGDIDTLRRRVAALARFSSGSRHEEARAITRWAAGRGASDADLAECRAAFVAVKPGGESEFDRLVEGARRKFKVDADAGKNRGGSAGGSAGGAAGGAAGGGGRWEGSISAGGSEPDDDDERKPVVSSVEFLDPLLLGTSIYAVVRTVVRLMGADDDVPPIVDSRVFLNVSSVSDAASWRAEISACLPPDVVDDGDHRAREFRRLAMAAGDALTSVKDCQLDAPLTPPDDDYHVTPVARFAKDGWALAFGSRGGGKSWFSRWLAVYLAGELGVRVAWVDLEGGAADDHRARRVWRGVDAAQQPAVLQNLLRVTSSNVTHPDGLQKLKARIADFGGVDFLIVDSATAATTDELSSSATAAAFFERMRSLDVRGGLAIAHTAKSNQGKRSTTEDGETDVDESVTALGSTVWESVPRLVLFSKRIMEGSAAWAKLGEGAEDEGAADETPPDVFRAPPADDVPPFYISVSVTKSNEGDRKDSGILLQVQDGSREIVFDHRPLLALSPAEKRRATARRIEEEIFAALSAGEMNIGDLKSAVRGSNGSITKVVNRLVAAERLDEKRKGNARILSVPRSEA